MKSPYLTLIALALFAALSTQTLGDNDLIVETWRCFDPDDWDKKKVAVKLTREKIPQGQTWGVGEVSAGGIVHSAQFQINGLEKRWNFDSNYSFVIMPDGYGVYLDFSMAERTKPTALYKCVSSK